MLIILVELWKGKRRVVSKTKLLLSYLVFRYAGIMMNKVSKNNVFMRYIKLIVGLFIVAIGQNLFLYCDLGMSPWSVFHQGLSMHFPITLGQASQIVGFIIIIGSMFFKIYPGIGTIINMCLVGFFVDFLIKIEIMSVPATMIGKLVMCAAGLIVLAFGMFMYMNQEVGAGPRDSLMLIITKRTRFKVGAVKNTIEITVLIIGIMLGGKFGIGTIAASILSGPALQQMFKIFKVNPKELRQENIIDVYNKVKVRAN